LAKGKKTDPRAVEGLCYDKNGLEMGWKVVGAWDKELSLVPTSDTGGVTRLMWQTNPFPPNSKQYYGFSSFATVLNQLPPASPSGTGAARVPAPTDSRYRPDQRALEDGEANKASTLKQSLEDAQRTRKAAKESVRPKWFKLVSRGGEPVDPEASPVIESGKVSPTVTGTPGKSAKSDEDEAQEWEYLGGYWEAQERGWDPAAFKPSLW